MTVPSAGGSPEARSSLVQADSYCEPKKWSCGKWTDFRKVGVNGLDSSRPDWLGSVNYRFSENLIALKKQDIHESETNVLKRVLPPF